MIPPAIRATVRDYIRAHDIFRPGPLVVAVSGGADSTALLLLLADLAPELGLVLHVAHFDHRTRPKQSAADADFVATLANSVGAPIRIGRAARAPKSEDEARRARYEFLRRAATEIGATAIATGHTRDDQAETVLLHLVRGAGLGGLAGIRPLRDGLARPLLAIARRETVAVCRAARVKPRTDPTNRALRFARNRVRLKVLPELAKINPRVVEAIARLADAAAETSAEEDRRTQDVLERSRNTGGAIDLNAIAEDLRGRVVALAWSSATGRALLARHRDALAELVARTDGSASLDLPGGRALREYGLVRIVSGDDAARPDPPARIQPGKPIFWNGWRIALGADASGDGVFRAVVPENFLRKLLVRGRIAGDRLVDFPRKKIQDVFIDAKVPASQRSAWAVIAVEEGVWWVPGLTEPLKTDAGTVLAVAAPAHFSNDLWTRRVTQVASTADRTPSDRRKGQLAEPR